MSLLRLCESTKTGLKTVLQALVIDKTLGALKPLKTGFKCK